MADIDTDFVVVGSGIAGLRAAVELKSGGRVLVLTKDAVSESATTYAQGGIAAATGEDDSIELHERDTLTAGDGLCDPEAVRILVEEGPGAIQELLEWGAAFDRKGNELQRTREGAHSRSRILHAHGDSTGREIAETLARRATAEKAITICPLALATRLIFHAGRVGGIRFLDLSSGGEKSVRCRAVLLATGGLGQVFSDTTNPPVATGDGPALASDAGAVLADMEFIQFHPTALALAGAPRFLLSEALRGEGAVLRNPDGERFMSRYHPSAELAPRDVVSRAIEMELRRAAESKKARAALTCYLDATHLNPTQLTERFPRISSTLLSFGLSLATDWIPVRPAAHYAMGGIWTDLDGRSSLPGLYAAGEAACTGVHGANRLASNSLLEGLVFGGRAGRAMLADRGSIDAADRPVDAAWRGNERSGPLWRPVNAGPQRPTGASQPKAAEPPFSYMRAEKPTGSAQELSAAIGRLRVLMWQAAGVIRNGSGLSEALKKLHREFPSADPLVPADPQHARVLIEWNTLRTAAENILISALAREESRGGHYREDFPQRDSALDGHHSFVRRREPVRLATRNDFFATERKTGFSRSPRGQGEACPTHKDCTEKA